MNRLELRLVSPVEHAPFPPQRDIRWFRPLVLPRKPMRIYRRNAPRKPLKDVPAFPVPVRGEIVFNKAA